MKHVLLAFTVALVACTSIQDDDLTPASGAPELRVATYNLYLGADIEPLLRAAPDPASVPAIVSQLFDAVAATDPPGRMDAVAALLAVEAPDVIALQEASLWRTQGEVAFDFTRLVLNGLVQRGLDYRVVVTQDNADVAAPDASGREVRMTDRDVLLARAGLPTSDAQRGRYEAQLQVTSTAIGTINAARGWVSMLVTVDGQQVRVLNTHLEAVSDDIRDLQAAELLTRTADEDEMLAVGDFNFLPESFPYDTFDFAELDDSGDAGPTCCQDVDLRNPQSKLSTRIDFVFERGAPVPLGVRRLGATSPSASGLWPSDHAGVVADFGL